MYICHRIGEMAEWSNAAVLKTVEGHTSGGSNPSFSAYIPRELNVFGVLFFWWSASPFLALKDVTDPSDLTMFWIMQKSLDCFDGSIPIPIITVEKGWKGWLEDRRPASNGDPYKIAARIIKTVKSA